MASLLLLLPLDYPFFLYGILIVVLLLSGVGLPIPEEVTLVVGGYLAYLEFIDFRITIYLLIAGIIAADLMGYCLGRYYGDWLWRSIFSRIPGMGRVVMRARHYFDLHGEKMVIIGRAFVAVRVAVPILAGHFKMNFKKFFIYDSIGAVPWTILLVSVSYYLASELDVITEIRAVKHGVFVGIIAVIIVSALINFLRKLYQEVKDV